MKQSRSDRSKQHCLLHHDYLTKTGKPLEAATLTGIHLGIGSGIGKSALSLTEGIVGIESGKGTLSGKHCQNLREISAGTVNPCNIAFQHRRAMQPVDHVWVLQVIQKQQPSRQ